GVRDLCDKYGILMVADEVMAGFGRTGRWFAIDHWDVTPDLMTMAKGLTSSYLPLGAVAMRHHVAEKFDSMMYFGGLTYSSHPVSLAAALATIEVYEDERLIENAARLGPVMRRHHEALFARHPSVGAHRNPGLFGILDLVGSRDPFVPMTPCNGPRDGVAAIRGGSTAPSSQSASTTSTSRRSTGGLRTTSRCRTSGTSSGRSSIRHSATAPHSGSSWPARRYSRSARRSPASPSAACSGS